MRCSRQVSALRRELERLGPTALRDRALAAGVSPKMVETWHTTAEYEKEMAAMRTEMRQLRANIGAGGIVRRELVQQVGPTRRLLTSAQPLSNDVARWACVLTPTALLCGRVAQGNAPQRSAQRPAGFGSEKAWDLALRECYGDFVRQHGIAPGVHRLRELLQAGGHCGAALAPRYPRQPEDADFHPWNNDPNQAARAPRRPIELHRVPGHLRGFGR